MALQSTGSLSFTEIENEFGSNATAADPRRTLGKYRISQNVGDMSNLPLDTGIAQGNSPIKFSQFRGKRLNVVVHYDSNFRNLEEINSGNIERAPTARQKYKTDDNVVVIGGFISKPNKSKGKKVIIHVSSTLGSTTDSRNSCALRTGEGWEGKPNEEERTELHINIGSEARVGGAGGSGGRGGDNGGGDGENGEDGSSAIGIQYPVQTLVIQEGGKVRAGGGGGGGGGGGKNANGGAVGGGGGDGSGIPNSVSDGQGRTRAENGGNGGGGGGDDYAGGGGGGGGSHPAGTVGGGGGNSSEYGAGTPGSKGFAIPKTGPGNINNSQADNGQDGTTSGGGSGGEGDCEDKKQKEGDPGGGGNNGHAILVESNVVREGQTFTINFDNSNVTGVYQGTLSEGDVI